MNSKSGIKLLTELLNLEGMRVTSYHHHEGIGIILDLEAEGKEGTCPRCGSQSYRLHQNHRYLVKDLPFSGQPVYLEVNRRQFKCEKCRKPFSEELNFINKRRNYTKRLAEEIVQQLLEKDIQSVAERNHVTPEEIETMLKDKSQEKLNEKPSDLEQIRNNGLSLVKGRGN